MFDVFCDGVRKSGSLSLVGETACLGSTFKGTLSVTGTDGIVAILSSLGTIISCRVTAQWLHASVIVINK